MRTQAVSDRTTFQQLVADIGSANGRPQAAIALDEYVSAMSDRPVPRISRITPHSTVAQLIQYVLDNFLSDDETAQRRSIKQLATLLEVVSGERPVVFLSPTQQAALTHTDVDDELLPAWSDLEPIIAFGATTTITDRGVAPHIRRGHIRRVWTGPLEGKREQRPTLIAPVIVNGHLGSPHRPIGYASTRQSR